MIRQIGRHTLILGDCLEVMPTLKSVDHVVSDPPYEQIMHDGVGKINRLRNDGVRTVDSLDFDGIDLIRADVARLCVEKSNGWLLLFTLAEGVRAWRDAIQDIGGKWDTTCFWIKPDASPRFNGQGPSRGAECIALAWCGTGSRSWSGGGRRGVFTHMTNNNGREGHPTEKPLSLMKELISLFTKPGDVVLDPFMGNSTTGVACAALDRTFIGIEKDETYFNMACDRMERAVMQDDLFMPSHVEKVKMEKLL